VTMGLLGKQGRRRKPARLPGAFRNRVAKGPAHKSAALGTSNLPAGEARLMGLTEPTGRTHAESGITGVILL